MEACDTPISIHSISEKEVEEPSAKHKGLAHGNYSVNILFGWRKKQMLNVNEL